jgi:hypothetical protein
MKLQNFPEVITVWRSNSNPNQIMEASWIRFLISELNTREIIGEEELSIDNTRKVVVITHGGKRGNLPDLIYFLNHLYQNQIKIALFHLGDEFNNENISFYKYCNVVFRNYYRPDIQESNIHFFPLGYKSGFKNKIDLKNWNQRQYDLSFAGQKGKRFEMINAVKNFKNSKLVVTETFNDPKGLSTTEYAQLLCNSKVILCPKGANIETFRLYEALEAGAIPLVEDEGGLAILRENFSSRGFSKLLSQRKFFVKRNLIKALKVESYWMSAFNSDFPCPRIFEWDNLPEVFARISLHKKSMQTQRWWEKYKTELKQKVTKCIRDYL